MNSQDALKQALEERFGLRNVRSDWVRRQTAFSTDIVAGPICRADLCEITEGTLPWNVLDAHSVQLGTKVLAQIEDIINIASADPRSSNAPRVLQLTLTDGCTDFVAVELEPLQRISLMTVPGTKIILHPTALVRRGRVFLTPKDFTFLGPPSSNIWGDAYDEKVASSLSAAGLRNPKASAFDSIARNALQSGEGVRVFPDMGGIADAGIITSNDNDDDDELWAEAAAFADQYEAGTNGAGRQTRQTAESHVESQAQQGVGIPRSVGVNPQTVVKDSSSAAQVHSTRQEQQEATFLDDSSNDGHEVIDIPEMPEFDSDAAAFGLELETTALQSDAMPIVNAVTEVDDFKVPELPLSRLGEASKSKDAGVEMSVYRAFVMKPVTKPKAVPHKKGFIVSVPFDDGTATANLAIDDIMLRRWTEVDFQPEYSQSMTSSSDDSKHASDVSRRPHKDARGITGFIEVRHDENNSVVAVSKEPPGGYPSFVAAYADNVEARLAQYLMEEAR